MYIYIYIICCYCKQTCMFVVCIVLNPTSFEVCGPRHAPVREYLKHKSILNKKILKQIYNELTQNILTHKNVNTT